MSIVSLKQSISLRWGFSRLQQTSVYEYHTIFDLSWLVVLSLRCFYSKCTISTHIVLGMFACFQGDTFGCGNTCSGISRSDIGCMKEEIIKDQARIIMHSKPKPLSGPESIQNYFTCDTWQCNFLTSNRKISHPIQLVLFSKQAAFIVGNLFLEWIRLIPANKLALSKR